MKYTDQNKFNKLRNCIVDNHVDSFKKIIDSEISNRNILTIIDEYTNQSLLHKATFFRNLEITTFLLEQNIPVNTQDYKGFTCLHTFVQGMENSFVFKPKLRNEDYILFHQLIENGVNLDIKNDYGVGALSLAIFTWRRGKCDYDLVELFLNQSTNIEEMEERINSYNEQINDSKNEGAINNIIHIRDCIQKRIDELKKL
ncbi:ankyrin repeat domain-containing protein [Flammeovirga sp. SJP92]|uniref:ankyrin repeat domain-containing protein n=1 Tax=Flammeovirga sp. SJP92 TaxID=1775430 RepID=UPI0012F876FE|nr:ankyrin repeat domain-containing protein [Flammeovirga sp. SJP92]